MILNSKNNYLCRTISNYYKMAKISNKSVYPEQIVLNIKDYLIGTDDLNAKRTKTFPIELFAQFITGYVRDNINNLDQNNKYRFVDLGVIDGYVNGKPDESQIASKINGILSNTSLTVASTELLIFKVHIHNGLGATQERKYFFPNMMGKGVYNPLISFLNFSQLEVAYIEPTLVPLDPDGVSDNVNNVVFDLGDLTNQDFLTYVNTIPNANYPTGYYLLDNTKIYYFRFTKDGATKIYFFDVDNSVNGYNIYGIAGSFSFTESELVLFYDSGIPPVIPQEKTKLSEFENDVPYLTEQIAAPNYTIDIVANQLKLYKEGVEVGSEDLSIYLDDTNLARLVSGTLDGSTGIATFTRDDASTFTIDFSSLIDVQVNSDWNAVSGKAQILNKPIVFPPDNHSHPISDITGLQTALDGKVDDSQVLTNVPSGALFTDTIYNDAPVTSHIANTLNPHSVTKTQVGLSNVDNVQQIPLTQKGAINGVAELDAQGFVKNTQLPSYVDDVIEGTLATFPATGETGKIYVDTVTNKTYRWSGTVYTVISETIALGETDSTAYRGDRGKLAYDHSQLTHDKTFVGLGNVDNTSDANKPISNAQQTALDDKVTKNANITGATKTKITYDAKGLVIAGADATTADIADSLNKRYVTDAYLTTLENTSGVNTGDQTPASLGLVIGTDVQAYNANTTIQGNTFNGVEQLVKTDATGKLPAIDGSQLTNLPNTGGGSLLTTLISTNTPAVKGNLYVLTATLTLTLPLNPTINDRVGVSNRSGTLTCVIARNGQNIQGLAEDMTVDALNIGFELVYTNATQGWVLQ